MKYPDEQVISAGSLVDLLRRHINAYDGPVWYRGQSNAAWPLVPKLMRAAAPNPSEAFLINRFKQNATLLLSLPPKHDFDWLFLMQHYSMPTRLLDWSESPLVSLSFAVTDNVAYDGALWILMPTVLNEMRIPDESDHYSGGKAATVPTGIRPAFRFDCGHHSGAIRPV